MADKITTVPKTKIGQRVGRLDDDDILRLNRAVLVFLGHIPIILLTALDRSDFHIRRGYSVGAMDYLYKPVIPAILRAKVSAFVDLYKKTEAVKRWEAERARTAEAAQARLISILEATPDLVAIAYPDGFANTLIAPDGDCSESTKTRTSARFD